MKRKIAVLIIICLFVNLFPCMDIYADTQVVEIEDESVTDTEKDIEKNTVTDTVSAADIDSPSKAETLSENGADLESELEDDSAIHEEFNNGAIKVDLDENGVLTVHGEGDYYIRSAYYYTDVNNCYASEYYRFLASKRAEIKKIIIQNWTGLTSTRFMFKELTELESVDLSGLDTSNVDTMSCMFEDCFSNSTQLVNLDLGPKFNTENVIYMDRMFFNCGSEKLQTLNLGSKFNTKKVITMESMFNGCGKMNLLPYHLGNILIPRMY